MKALARLKDPRGVGPVAARLQNIQSRGDAKEALIAFGPSSEGEIVKLLDNGDVEIRQIACEILGKIGTSRSVPALQQLARGSNFRLQNAAKDALNEIQKR